MSATARSGPRARWGWPAIALLIAAPGCLPLLAILGALPQLDAELWSHFLATLLPDVVVNTLWLMLGVGVGVAVLGTTLAALVSLTDFPGRRLFAWLLLLPLAMPGYVLATVVIGALDYAGPIASALREWGIGLPSIRSRGGVILTLVLTLYPYVYLVARNAFASQGARAIEAARLLGYRPLSAFLRVALPQARPWIAGGTLLALMETLADFGTVSAFGYITFTTAIYRAWFALFSIDAALQLAGVLLVIVIAMVWLEHRSRRHARYERRPSATARLSLGPARWMATALCAAVLVLAFVLPAVQLLAWAVPRFAFNIGDIELLWHSLALAGGAAVMVPMAALLLALAARLRGGTLIRSAQRLATLGYALPGPLLALGLFVPFAAAVGTLNAGMGWTLAISGGLGLMLLAYGVRFLAVAHTPLHTQLLRIGPNIDATVQLMDVPARVRLSKVYLPPLATALLTGALLVFVDVMKEMPITLMMRPFGWDTLAVRVFELTREGEWQRAALPSLAIVAAGLIPVWLLNRGLDRGARDGA